MSWWDNLRQASFRGVPFGVEGSSTRVGRRLSVHEYTGREVAWAEDLGKRVRGFQVVGFLLENDGVYGGGDVMAQRDRMLRACETKGPGQLVHPTLGALQVSVEGLEINERKDNGRYFELVFSFIETGQRVFPSISTAGSSALDDATDGLDLASVLSFVGQINRILRFPVEAVKQATATAAAWGALAGNLASDATNLFNITGTLQGAYGRFFGGALRGLTGGSPLSAAAPTTVAGLIAQGAASRAKVGAAVKVLSAASAGLSPATSSALGSAAQGLVSALLASASNPADGIRLLSALAAFNPAPVTVPSVIGSAMSATQAAMADLFRRSAVAGVARASSSYQPASTDEAVQVRNAVVALLDGEIDIAGDQADDAAYKSLRLVRQGVIADMNAKGAGLPAMQTVIVKAPLPAPVLAQLLYQDASRADELVSEAGPPHPAFMPTKFRALAS